MAFRTKIKPYAVITLDLGTVRTDLAQGTITLRGVSISSWMVNTITVLTLGGGSLSFRKNTNTNDLIPGSDGLKVEGNPVTELFWTNAVQAGKTAQVYIAWVD